MEFDRLLLWIESQPAIIIALIAFGACYLCAATIFGIARVLVSQRIATELKATTPVMLTPLSVLTGLVIAFVASRVWINFDHAHAIVRDEARSIEKIVTLADRFPQNVETDLRHGIGEYLQFVKQESWPAMLGGLQKCGPRYLDLPTLCRRYCPLCLEIPVSRSCSSVRWLQSNKLSTQDASASCSARLPLSCPCSGSPFSFLER